LGLNSQYLRKLT